MRTIIHKALKYNWLIFGMNVWFLIVNAMDFSKAYKKIINFIYNWNQLTKYMNCFHKISRLQELYACQLRKKVSIHSKFIPIIGRKMEKILLVQFS
ncbi:hypothetical protein Glove_60g82 [Diversispora epigaea]|uniref:Uncharacterized protein n=1 Tax=Diversispora epigaea TaxID=1348612 RepID=A0A397JG83_9GLOM|nr:hypothetical protein Glove_60g82 [Diversispora epigaea]